MYTADKIPVNVCRTSRLVHWSSTGLLDCPRCAPILPITMSTESIQLDPVKTNPGLKDKVYVALRDAIARMDIYQGAEAPKLDERYLAESLGVSRTPVREALSRLEQEGLVRSIPRRGAFVVRKTKKEILEVIQVWAAIESMAARLATAVASDEELRGLRKMFVTFQHSHGPQHASMNTPRRTSLSTKRSLR